MSFTLKQQVWVEQNNHYFAQSYPLHHALIEGLYQVHGLEEIKRMGQGCVSKTNKLASMVRKIFDVQDVPNYIPSKEHYWSDSEMAMIARDNYDNVVQFVVHTESAS